MSGEMKRVAIFFGVCVVVRSLLVVLAKNFSPNYLRLMGMITLIPATGFLYLYFTDTYTTGPGPFGGKIWWGHLRLLHGMLYLAFSYLAITGDRTAWRLLALDVFLGILAVIHKYFIA